MYRFINEDEEESLGASFTIKKISDITGGGRGGRITTMGSADLFYEKSSIVAWLPG